MPRFNLYQGVKGQLVGHPRAGLGNRRFVCQSRLADPPAGCEFHECFEPIAEVHEEHAMLRKAVNAGALKVLNKRPVEARTHAEATAVLAPASPEPKKADGKKGSN